MEWVVEDFLTEMPQRIAVTIAERTVRLRCWKYELHGVGGCTTPVYFLDADLPENTDYDRTLTHFPTAATVRMLRALGYDALDRFHMNEGHASLLVLELLDEAVLNANRKTITDEDIDAVRKQIIHHAHTGACGP